MANDLTVTQIASIVNSIMSEVTGEQTTTTTIDTAQFVNVAQTALKTGYDPLAIGISQVLSRTIMSVRPYDRKFAGLMRTNEQWGNHTRKIQFVDRDATDNDAFKLVNGQSIDMYKVALEDVLQTNFYGQSTFDFFETFTRKQLASAFHSPEELARYFSAKMLHIKNQREQRLENLNRFTLNNFIAGKTLADPSNVLHLVTLYNSEKGTSLTSATVMQPANFEDFARWMYAKLETLAGYMSERTIKYHMNITGSPIHRHTPARNLKMYMLSSFENEVRTEVLATTYNESYLRFADHERVNWWQNPNAVDSINVKASYTGTDGTVKTSEEETSVDHVIGVLFDEEAIGSTIADEHANTTPQNAFGDYYNMAWKGVYNFWNDFTENALVLCLD